MRSDLTALDYQWDRLCCPAGEEWSWAGRSSDWTGEDGGQDVLTIEAGGGNDRISAGLLTGDGMKLEVRGGAGNDVIRGGAGRYDLFGQTGRDDIFGGRGNDELSSGSGVDRFIFAGQNGSDQGLQGRGG